MRKIPLFLKILVPLLVVFAAAGVFFCIKYFGTNKVYAEKMSEIRAIEADAPEKKATDYKASKRLRGYPQSEYESQLFDYSYSENYGTYEHEGIEFISFSESWDAANLEELCRELFENAHGDEIYELDAVVLYEGYIDIYPPPVSSDYDWLYVPMSLFEMVPQDFVLETWRKKNVINVFRAGEYDTVDKIAHMLSYSYGTYFMATYFDLYGEDETVENDPYFKLRHDKKHTFYYKEDAFLEWDDYYDNNKWYLLDIAAEDYAYLMGSPKSKRIVEYIDTQDQLRLDIKNKDEELAEYHDTSSGYAFNQSPHPNTLLPFPDQVKGLPELLYGAIGKEAPEYTDRTKEAAEIEIKVSKRTYHGKKYYDAVWEKPWDDEDVTYTLVAYDENDELIGAIKTIDGTEKARAIFGGAALDSSSTTVTYYDDDYWSRQGFLRLRIIATFSDGTAVISPSVDWSFK